MESPTSNWPLAVRTSEAICRAAAKRTSQVSGQSSDIGARRAHNVQHGHGVIPSGYPQVEDMHWPRFQLNPLSLASESVQGLSVSLKG